MSEEDHLELAKKNLVNASMHIQNLAQEDVKRICYELATSIKHILELVK